MIKNTNTNTTRRQIRDIFRYAEKYGLEKRMDDTLADQIRGIRFQDSGITGALRFLRTMYGQRCTRK